MSKEERLKRINTIVISLMEQKMRMKLAYLETESNYYLNKLNDIEDTLVEMFTLKNEIEREIRYERKTNSLL